MDMNMVPTFLFNENSIHVKVKRLKGLSDQFSKKQAWCHHENF